MKKKIFSGLAMLVISVSSQAQFGNVQKQIENALKANDANNRGESVFNPDVAISERTGAQFAGIIDIKGIRIGMRYDEITKLLNNQVEKNSPCVEAVANFQQNTNLYRYGDKIIHCQNNFTYFGSKVDDLKIAFYNGKVNFVTIAKFYAGTRTTDMLSPIAKTLAEEKFKVQPKIYIQKHPHSEDLGNLDAVWVDSQGSKLSYSTDYKKDLSGVIFKNGVIELESKDFNTVLEARTNQLNQRANQMKNTEENKKKSDL